MLLSRSRATVVLALLSVLALAVPAHAQDPQQEAATEALEQVEDLASGQDVETGRELSPALLDLAQARGDLTTAQRRRANRIVARPTDPGDDGPGSLGPYTAASTSSCTAHFCVHWVESSGDKPPDSDGDPLTVPSYIETMKSTFEQVYQEENGTLGWRAPLADAGRGGDDRVDVYVQDIGREGIFGYASTDTQPNGRSLYSYLVMDNDYAEFGYPSFLPPLQVTAAHEYNHVLQYAYDARQDDWMFESTATWAEDKVFGSVDDYVNYMDTWAALPEEPLTSAGDGVPADDDLKMYGSAVWNHWLDGRYGPEVVRDAWAGSAAAENTVQGGGFAPKAYDAAIKSKLAGVGFAREFGDFATATATWEVPGYGFHEGEKYGDVRREATLAPDGAPRSATLDHTAFAMYDISPTAAGRLDLSAALPDGTAGYIALVGRNGSTVNRAAQPLPSGGGATVSLADPATYSRITAVLINADTQNAGFDADCGDWNWTRDDQTVAFAVSAHDAGDPPSAAPATPAGSLSDCSPAVTSTPTPTATATPTPVPTVTPIPTPTQVLRTSLTLSRSTTRIASAVRTGYIGLFARTNKAGRLSAKSTVDAATARRLKVGRRTTTTGTARRTATAPSRLKLKVRLTRKARAALRKQRSRTVRVKVRVMLVPADGTAAVTRTISILLRP